ncbi:C-Maf-inducing protein isoform X2 [Cephus cinctus]|uniref:C-Maf-inducing protein isoform X2 n=1 Tax=Cephus cinctus TaxID=211228 RepID=A0AAJ7R8B7_CEPCN|nr:C-Maf-inducing protein isoform X2 [Cephus cinctus]
MKMFCFQSPFARASRGVVPPPPLSTQATTTSSDLRRRGSEATSEGSGSSSIRFIDQELSMSGGSSTDTLPGIRADYLETDPLSPGPDSIIPETPSAKDTWILVNGVSDDTNDGITLSTIDNKLDGAYVASRTQVSPSQKAPASRWRRKLLLRLRSTDSSASSTGETSSPSPSPASDSTPSSARNQNGPHRHGTASSAPFVSPLALQQGEPTDSGDVLEAQSREVFASVNDIPSFENGFSDLDEDPNQETETEEGSLPSSPAAAVGLVPSVPYYGFLSANGSMRQETTSTSSPQLSSGTSPRSSAESPPEPEAGSFAEDTPVNVNLQPQPLETTCLPAARSCPNLERQSAGCSSASGSSSPSPSPGPAGPRFKPLEEGDIQVCYLNHTRTLVSKILSSKFLRRWETHHLYLNDACLSSKTLTGFLQQPVPYSSMSEVYTVARWDPTYKYCLRIVLPDGSLLLQASNAYTRDQWYHSILWKKSIFKYQHLVSSNTRDEIVLRELKTMVDFALWTPLQDERVAGAPLEAVAKLLEDPVPDDESSKISNEERETEDRSWAEAVLAVAAPLLEKAAPPPALARALARLAQRHPKSPLVLAQCPAITRCLKHTVDFGKSPDMRKLLQVFIAALHENNDGEQAIRDYIASVHGPGSDCPHPRVLPNLVSICVAAIFHRFEVSNRTPPSEDQPTSLPPLRCYLLVLNVASEYADWRPGLGALLQPVPFPEEALADKEVQETILLCAMQRLAKDPRCSVHRVLLPVREPRPGWIHIVAPSSPACPDQGQLFGEMLTTLLACCCRRKRFIGSLMKQAGGACVLLGVRDCDAAQEALCLMLEWRLLPNEEARLQVVSALQSTPSGRNRYADLCQRQRNLQELKGGPRKLTLPVRATDADVALLLGGGALGNLECLSLAFTSVTSACAEQLIKLPALRYLNLWATQFGDAGLQMISEHLQKLQVLNLCETPVSDKGISTLASLTSLRKLNLNSTKLSAQTFESLKKRLPALQEFDVRYTEAW